MSARKNEARKRRQNLAKKEVRENPEKVDEAQWAGNPWDIEAVMQNRRFFLSLEGIVENYRTYDPVNPSARPIWNDKQRLQGLPPITDYFPHEFVHMIDAPPPMPREEFQGPSLDPELTESPQAQQRSQAQVQTPDEAEAEAQSQAQAKARRKAKGKEPAHAMPPKARIGGVAYQIIDGWSLDMSAYPKGSLHKPSASDEPGPSYSVLQLHPFPPPGQSSRLWGNWRNMSQFPEEVQVAMTRERAAARLLIEDYDEFIVEEPGRMVEADEHLNFELPQFERYEPVPNPTEPLPLLSATCGPLLAQQLRCGLFYTEHTETLTIPDVHTTFPASEIPTLKAVRDKIDAFLTAFHLPPFSESDYTYFFCPSVTGTQLASKWTRQKNAALVIRPLAKKKIPSFAQRRRDIPALMAETDELVSKSHCQLGMLRVLNEVMQEFWEDRGLLMFAHADEWSQFDSAPNAFCSVLLRLLRRAEEQVAKLVERRKSPARPADPITEQLGESTRRLAERRARLAQLEQELEKLQTSNAHLRRQLDSLGPAPDPAAMEEKRRRYHTIAEPMFKIWGRTMIEYARLQARDDLQLLYEIKREQNPDRWLQYNQDAHEIKKRPELMKILQRHGMDVGLLLFTRMNRGGYSNPIDTAAGEAAHHSAPEAMAAAITSQHLLHIQKPLRDLFRFVYPDTDPDTAAATFRSRYRDNQAWVDLV